MSELNQRAMSTRSTSHVVIAVIRMRRDLTPSVFTTSLVALEVYNKSVPSSPSDIWLMGYYAKAGVG